MGAGVTAADADLVQPAVVAQGEDSAGVDARAPALPVSGCSGSAECTAASTAAPGAICGLRRERLTAKPGTHVADAVHCCTASSSSDREEGGR